MGYDGWYEEQYGCDKCGYVSYKCDFQKTKLNKESCDDKFICPKCKSIMRLIND